MSGRQARVLGIAGSARTEPALLRRHAKPVTSWQYRLPVPFGCTKCWVLTLPTTEWCVARGTLSVDNFIMPVFGNRVVLSAATTTTSAAGAPAGGDKPPSLLPWLGISSGPTTVWRVYGSGESTYQHQLQRFVADVRAVKEAEGSGDKGWVAGSGTRRTDARRKRCGFNHWAGVLHLPLCIVRVMGGMKRAWFGSETACCLSQRNRLATCWHPRAVPIPHSTHPTPLAVYRPTVSDRCSAALRLPPPRPPRTVPPSPPGCWPPALGC